MLGPSVILPNINRHTLTLPWATILTSQGPCPGSTLTKKWDPAPSETRQTFKTSEPHMPPQPLPPPHPPPPPPPLFPHPVHAIMACLQKPQHAQQPGPGLGTAKRLLLRWPQNTPFMSISNSISPQQQPGPAKEATATPIATPIAIGVQARSGAMAATARVETHQQDEKTEI